MLTFRTLGGIELEARDRDQRSVLSHPKRVGLLAYLALTGTFQRRDTLIGLFWPESEEDRARASLRQAVHHLRRVLGTEVIVSRGDEELGLAPGVLACDAVEFVEAARAHRYRDALGLYRGELLPGLFVSQAPGFEDWLERQRSELRRMAVESSWALAGAVPVSDAPQWGLKALALDPLDEAAVRRVMELQDRAGDSAGALRTHHEFATRLRAELEIAPSPETTALAEAIRGRRGEASRVVPDATWEPPPPAAAPPILPARDLPRRPAYYLLALLAILVLGSATWTIWRNPFGRHPRDRTRVVVVPFRVAGTETDLRFLGEGMLDLLNAKFGQDGGLEAVDARTVMSLWRGADSSTVAEFSNQDALDLAARLGGGQVILGAVVGRPTRLVITASLLEVPGGREQGRASVEGPADSLPELVDQLAAQLIARRAGEMEPRIAGFTRVRLPALKAYLDGQAAYRRGEYPAAVRFYDAALQSDSSLVMAAVQLASAALWDPTAEALRRRALAFAWSNRDRLGPPDQAFLVALAGPRYPAEPTQSERLAAWEAVVRLSPERPDAWYEYGDVLFHQGARLGVAQSWDLARRAFDRAIRLDSSYASALIHRYELATGEHDSAGALRLSRLYLLRDSTSDHAAFVRWRSAVVGGHEAERQAILADLTRLSFSSLWRMIGVAQLDGVALEDAGRAAAELSARPTDRLARHETAGYLIDLALNRGKPLQAAGLLNSLFEGREQHAILDALYGDGDSAAAAQAARSLSRRDLGWVRGDSVATAFRFFDRCALGHWRAWQGDSTGLGATIQEFSRADDDNLPWWAVGQVRICALELQAFREMIRTGEPDARTLGRLDSLLATGPEAGIRDPGHLVSSRLHATLSDWPAALDAVRRRQYHHRTGVPYLAVALRDEGGLALRTGDTAGAARAWRHYLLLRADPEPRLRAERDSIRRQVAGLDLTP